MRRMCVLAGPVHGIITYALIRLFGIIGLNSRFRQRRIFWESLCCRVS